MPVGPNCYLHTKKSYIIILFPCLKHLVLLVYYQQQRPCEYRLDAGGLRSINIYMADMPLLPGFHEAVSRRCLTSVH